MTVGTVLGWIGEIATLERRWEKTCDLIQSECDKHRKNALSNGRELSKLRHEAIVHLVNQQELDAFNHIVEIIREGGWV